MYEYDRIYSHMGIDSNNLWKYLIGIVIFILLAIGIFYLLSDYTIYAKVSNTYWTRTIYIDRYTQLEDTSLVGFEPSDAYNKSYYTYTWVTYRDDCYGSGKNRHCDSIPDYHSEYRVRYNINRWIAYTTLVTQGSPKNERIWADFTPSKDLTLGALRENPRGEDFTVSFTESNNNTWNYTQANISIWRKYHTGASWQFNANHLNIVDWSTLVQK